MHPYHGVTISVWSAEVVSSESDVKTPPDHPLVVVGHINEMCHMQFIMHCFVKIHVFFPGVVVPVSVIM